MPTVTPEVLGHSIEIESIVSASVALNWFTHTAPKLSLPPPPALLRPITCS